MCRDEYLPAGMSSRFSEAELLAKVNKPSDLPADFSLPIQRELRIYALLWYPSGRLHQSAIPNPESSQHVAHCHNLLRLDGLERCWQQSLAIESSWCREPAGSHHFAYLYVEFQWAFEDVFEGLADGILGFERRVDDGLVVSVAFYFFFLPSLSDY